MDPELINALRPVLVDILAAIDQAAGGGGEGAQGGDPDRKSTRLNSSH